MQRFVAELGEAATVSSTPSMQGYSMSMILAPVKK